MFDAFFSLLGFSSHVRRSVLDDTDFTYRVKNFSNSENDEPKIEETFVKSVVNPVENYEGLSVEQSVESPIITPVNSPNEQPKEVYCAQDYDKILKPVHVELDESCYEEETLKQKVIEDTKQESESESDSESDSEKEEPFINSLYGQRCKRCKHFHETVQSHTEEENRGDFMYAILLDNKVLGYVDDHKQLLDYLVEIKTRIRNHYMFDGNFRYWMRYFWNETINFQWNNDLVVKYSLVSMNLHNLITYDRLEATLSVHRMKNLLLK